MAEMLSKPCQLIFRNNRVPLVPTAPRDYHIQAPEINQNERVVVYQATNPAPLICIINYWEPKSKFRAIYCSNGHLVCKKWVPYYLF